MAAVSKSTMPSTDSPGDEKPPGTEFRESRHGVGFRDGQTKHPDGQRQGRVRSAEITRLRQDRDTLKEKTERLEEELNSLEKERAGLEQTVEYKERQKQQLIENYEQVLESRQHHRPEDSKAKEAQTGQQSTPSDPRKLRPLLRVPLSSSVGMMRKAVRRLRKAVDRITERS